MGVWSVLPRFDVMEYWVGWLFGDMDIRLGGASGYEQLCGRIGD